MADLFDYIFTCDVCGEQYEEEGRRGVDSEYVTEISWELKEGKLSFSTDENRYCEYCFGEHKKSMVSIDDAEEAAWVEHYLSASQQSDLCDHEWVKVPFKLDLSPEECLEEAIKKDKAVQDAQRKRRTEKVLAEIKSLLEDPDCDVATFVRNVRASLPQ